MPVSDELKKLVDRMPDPDDRRMYCKNMDKAKIDAAVEEIYKGGPANMQGLVEMLGPTGSAENVKPHYALHCVLNLSLIKRDMKTREAFCKVLADALAGDYPTDIKAYLCQELQWAGRSESTAALGKLLSDEALCDPAAMALTAIGSADELRKALPGAKGRCRLAILDALVDLADTGSAAEFEKALGDEDRDVRITGGAGLVAIGDPRAAAALKQAAEKAKGYEAVCAKRHLLVLEANSK